MMGEIQHAISFIDNSRMIKAIKFIALEKYVKCFYLTSLSNSISEDTIINLNNH